MRPLKLLEVFFLSLFIVPSYGIYDSADLNGFGNGEEGGGTFHTLNRSGNFRRCEKYAQKQWSQIIPDNDDRREVGYIDAALGGSQGDSSGLRANLFAKMKSDFDKNELGPDKVKLIAQQLFICEAYFTVTRYGNYDEQEDLPTFYDDKEAKSVLGGQGLACLNQPTPQAQQQCMIQAQGQGELKCVHKGPETHDFLACKKIINFIDAFALGKQAMQIQQSFRAGSAQAEAESDLARKQQVEGTVQITDVMNVQKDSLQQQGNLAYEMAAFDAGKAGILLNMIDKFPRPSDFLQKCQSNINQARFVEKFNENLLRVLSSAQSTTSPQAADGGEAPATPSEEIPPISPDDLIISGPGDLTINGQGACEFAIASRNGNYLFRNQKTLDTIRGIAYKAGIEALANGAKGALLHQQAGLVEDAMDDIQEFEPPEFPVAEAPDNTASECLVDPEAEGCIAPDGVAFQGFRDQGGFNGSFGGGASLGNGNSGTDFSDEESSGAGNTNRGLIPENFGAVQNTSASDNKFEDGPAGAGSIKTGQAAPAGGGGAGGGGGGGLAGGGGGGGKRQPGKKGPTAAKDIKIKTKGSGLGQVGGFGAVGARKKKKSANPFSKLLGKNKGKGNQTLNFRGPAQLGGKKGSLFQMISNRYNKIQSKDRLLKYEAKN